VKPDHVHYFQLHFYYFLYVVTRCCISTDATPPQHDNGVFFKVISELLIETSQKNYMFGAPYDPRGLPRPGFCCGPHPRHYTDRILGCYSSNKNDNNSYLLTGRELHVTVVGALESGGLELNAKETKLLVCAYLLKKMEEEITL
jgi:hypothetical protein